MTHEGHYYYGLGRRKEAIAQVRVYAGVGPFVVNGRSRSSWPFPITASMR